jgi:hypothetical protein
MPIKQRRKVKMFVYELPFYLYAFISEYFVTATIDEPVGHCNEYAISWRNFCNSTKLLYEVKQHFIVYDLNWIHSLGYVNYASGRIFNPGSRYDWLAVHDAVTKLSTNIRSSLKQIRLTVYSNDLRDCFSGTAHLSRLQLVNGINSDYRVSYLISLTAFYCSYRSYYCGNCTQLTKVKVLKLGCCSFSDISPLSNCLELSLESNPLLTDVSPLKNIKKLRLRCCENLVDVFPLANVKHLDLTGCVKVCDVSALGNVRTLLLSHCVLVKDIRALGRVRHLNLLYIETLHYGLPEDNSVKVLSISSSLLEMVSTFHCKEQKQLIVYCHPTFRAPLIDGYQTVTLKHSESSVISNLPSLKKLSLDFCSDLTLLSGLPLLSHLEISGNRKNVSELFHSLQSLSVVSLSVQWICPSHFKLPASVKEVTISSLFAFSLSLSSDLRLLSLYLDGCNKPVIRNSNRFRIEHLKIQNARGKTLEEKWT